MIVKKWFFDNKDDIFEELRVILEDFNYFENYWLDIDEDGYFKCYFCDKLYVFVGSLKVYEIIKYQYVVFILKKKFLLVLCKDIDELFNYIVLVFKFIVLLKNFDIVIDMGDGVRFV